MQTGRGSATDANEFQGTLGEELDALLDTLRNAELRIGARERLAASTLSAHLLATGQVRTLADMRASLGALLARTPKERETFERIFAAFAPGSSAGTDLDDKKRQTDIPRPRPDARAPIIVGFAVAAFVAIAAVLGILWLPPGTGDVAPTGPKEIEKPIAGGSNVGRVALPISEPTPEASIGTLNRVAEAAARFDGAPTLSELSEELARGSRDWTAPGYRHRLADLTGLPTAEPLALYGDGSQDGAVIWARIAQALDRIEQPGRERPFSEMLAKANSALAAPPQLPLYEIAQRLPTWFATPDTLAPDKATLIADIQQKYFEEHTKETRAPSPTEALDEQLIERALAITPAPGYRRTFSDAVWRSSHPPAGAMFSAWWIKWLATLLPLVAVLFWLAHSVALRKAYLRRRPPDIPPLHTDLVFRSATRVRYASGIFRRAAARLLTRTPVPTFDLDIERTVRQTLTQGGHFVAPVFREVRRAPEYLVLIERRTGGDQDAKRLRDLIGRLEPMVSLSVYYFQTEPSLLEPEKGGRQLPIEHIQSAHAGHRLVILGSGRGLIDIATNMPHEQAVKLTFWERRALLTPLPLAEWSGEEFALAHGLTMPVGRATPEGLAALADLLRLTDAAEEDLLDMRGDGLARPLPETLRHRPERYLYPASPPGQSVADILNDLRNFLDGPGFEWLASLAVYPSVQWDLTLYLGVALPERSGGNEEAAPLYSEARIAALTQLPWLKEGLMPTWLRRALIRELRPVRAREVREVLVKMLDRARLKGTVGEADAVKLRIGRQVPREKIAPDDLFDDEVLLDFMARGRVEDFALPASNWLESIIPRRLLDRIGIPEVAVGSAAAAYAAVAWWIAPRPEDGALVTGVFLPLATLALGALVALAGASPVGAYRTTYRFLQYLSFWSAGTLATFAYAWVTWRALSYRGALAWVGTEEAGGEANGIVAAAALLLALLPCWITVRGLAKYFAIRGFSPRGPLVSRVFIGLISFAIFLSLALATLLVAGDASPDLSANVRFLVTFATLAVVGGLATRLLPERIDSIKKPAAVGPLSPLKVALRTGLAILPVLPALALFHHISSSSIVLSGLAGATAAAETPSGTFVAVADEMGTVEILDRSHTVVRSIKTDLVPITGLAIHANDDGDATAPLILGVASAQGGVRLYDALSGLERPVPDALRTLTSLGAPTRLALGPGAVTVVATETSDGVAHIASPGGSLDIDAGGPVTHLISLDGTPATPLFAAATLDGKLRVFTALDRAPPKLIDINDESGTEPAQIQLLEFDRKTRLLHAIGVDGSVRSARIGSDQPIVITRQAEVIKDLAVGPAIRWERPTAPETDETKRAPENDAKTDVGAAKAKPSDSCGTIEVQKDGKPNGLTIRTVQSAEARLTSGFGLRFHPLLNERRLHTGIDWAAPVGAPVTAAGPGRIVEIGRRGEYGNLIVIDHGQNVRTLYSQLSKFDPKSVEDGCVEQGDVIAYVGSTGLSSGPHLHLEVQVDGKAIDPLSVMPKGTFPQEVKIGLADLIGAPESVTKELTTNLQLAFEGIGFSLDTPASDSNELHIQGYLVATIEKPNTKLSYIFDVTKTDTGARVHRIAGDTTIPPQADAKSVSSDPWSRVTGEVASNVAERIASEFLDWKSKPASKPGTERPGPEFADNPPADTPVQAATSTVPPANQPSTSEGRLLWPTTGIVISGFGPRPDGSHNDGINIAAPRGTEVRAADGGVVAYAGDELRGYGNLILIRHNNNLVTAYAHADAITVKRGDDVKRGEVIAKVGSTGGVDAPQLHFEVRDGQKPVDPLPFFNTAVMPVAENDDARSNEAQQVAQTPENASPKNAPASILKTGKLLWPVKGAIISGFGPRPDGTHNDGVNVAAPLGTNIRAAEAGVVAYADNDLKGYGNLVLLRHDDDFVTAYAHADKLMIKRGDKVKRGQVIGTVGRTGEVDLPQLHLELRQGSKPIDPLPYFDLDPATPLPP